MEEGDAGDGGLSVPQPTEYRRMLSWQLSHAQTAPVTTKSRKTQKKRERRREKDGGDSVASGDAARVDSVASSEEDEGVDGAGEFAYLVVNSEGEEEWYYSAPESPLDSGEEPWSGTCASRQAVESKARQYCLYIHPNIYHPTELQPFMH